MGSLFKKLSSLLSLLLVFSLVFNFNSVSASEDDPIKLDFGKFYLEVNENGSITPSSKIVDEETVEKAKKEAKKQYTSLPQKIDISETTESNLKKEDNYSPQAVVSYVGLSIGGWLYPSEGKIEHTLTIDEIIGEQPTIIVYGHSLYAGTSRYGSYSQKDIKEGEWAGTQIYVGQSSSKVYQVENTNYWVISANASSAYLGGDIQTASGQTNPFLTNKKASPYPSIQDYHSGIIMTEPSSTTWVPVPEDQRVPWDNKIRGQYITEYINTYGDPGWNWADYDIHHIKPREYGGNNTFSNLMPLIRSTHQQIVNPWWINY